MIDKELEAMYKCHEYLQDLDNEARMRVFKYLLDRYGLVNNPEHLGKPAKFIPNNVETETIPVEELPKTNKQQASVDLDTSIRSKKSKVSSPQSYSLLTSLNLLPKGQKSLKEYFSEYETTSNYEYNIVILSYLKNILDESKVGPNHFYTCYKHLGIKVPNIVQSLRDTKNRKGWIDTSHTDDVTITVAGENFIDHEIGKRQI